MRGHIKKRVAGKLLRRIRRRKFAGEKIRQLPALKPIRGLVRARRKQVSAFKHRRASVSRLGGYTRKVARAGLLRYDSVIYGSQVNRLWRFRYLSVLGGLRKYFLLKTIRSYERDVSKRYFRKKKRRIPQSPKNPSIKNISSPFVREKLWKIRGIDDELDLEEHNVREALPVMSVWSRLTPKTLWSITAKRYHASRRKFRRRDYLVDKMLTETRRGLKVDMTLAYDRKWYYKSFKMRRNMEFYSIKHRHNYWIHRVARGRRHVRRKWRFVRRKRLRVVVLKQGSLQSLQYGKLRGSYNRHLLNWYKLLKGKSAAISAVHALTNSYRYSRGSFNVESLNGLTVAKRSQLQKSVIFGKLLGTQPLLTSVIDTSTGSSYSVLKADSRLAKLYGDASSAIKAGFADSAIANSSGVDALATGARGLVGLGGELVDSIVASKSVRAYAEIYKNLSNVKTGLSRSVDFTSSNEAEDEASAKAALDSIVARGVDFSEQAVLASRQYGEVGAKHGAFAKKTRSRRFRASHYTARVLKYRQQRVYSSVSRWSSMITQKILARNRMEFYYTAEEITLAPRMFGVYNYRTATLGKFFEACFGSTFVYVYLHSSYADKLLGGGLTVSLKTFVLHDDSKRSACLAEFNKKIAEYMAVLAKDLEIKRSKNKPDYCYYLNARMFWNDVVDFDHAVDHGDFEITELWSLVNYHTLCCCLEVYKVVNALIVLSFFKK